MAQISNTFSGGTNSSRYQGYLNYSEGTVDTANNRSYVYLNLYIGSNNASYSFYGYNNYGYIYVDGAQYASGNYTGTVNTNAQQICAWEGWIGHNGDGTKYITVGYTINSGYAGNSSASTGWSLTNIPRYANINSLTSSSTDVAITANVGVDATCDTLSLSIDNGATYPYVLSGDFTSKSITTTGAQLQSNKTYNCYVAVKRKDSQLTTYSSAFNVTTAGQSNFMALL